MGFFGNLFGSKPAQATVQAVSQSVPVVTPSFTTTVTNTPTQTVPSHSKINLLKEREVKVKINLEKKSTVPVKANVVFVLDVSCSMQGEFMNGLVQDILERVYPIALHMTKELKNKEELDCYLFSSSCYPMTKINMENFAGYVKNNILSGGSHRSVLWGGTSYAPVMQSVQKFYQNSDVPTYVIFITDGDNSDHGSTETVVIESSKYPIFWQFVGIGQSRFSFLEKLDNMDGRVVDNANFFQLNDIRTVSDDELYKRILNEFPDWLVKAKGLGIIK